MWAEGGTSGLSWQAVGYVKRLPGLTPTEKLVALCLADDHNAESGEAWPSAGTLAGYTGLTKRAVFKALGALEQKGVIAVERRHDAAGDRASNTYRFPGLGVVNDVHHPLNQVHQGSEPRSSRVVNVVHQGSEPRSPKPTSEPAKQNRPVNRSTVAAALATPPAALMPFDAILREWAGYAPTERFYTQVITLQQERGFDAEREAVKLTDWLRRKRIRQCTVARVLNWLERAEGQSQPARNGQRNGSVLGQQDATAEVYRKQREALEAEYARIDAETAAEEAALAEAGR
jgi:hypothetical protein